MNNDDIEDGIYGISKQPATTTDLEEAKKQWLERCAKRFEERADLNSAYAMECAELCLDAFSLSENPEEAADEEMSNWTDDGEG